MLNWYATIGSPGWVLMSVKSGPLFWLPDLKLESGVVIYIGEGTRA